MPSNLTTTPWRLLSGQAAQCRHRGPRVDIAEDVLLEEPQRQQFAFLYRVSGHAIGDLGCTNPVLVDVGDHVWAPCVNELGRRPLGAPSPVALNPNPICWVVEFAGELNKEPIWIAVRRQLLCDDQRVSRVAGGLLGKQLAGVQHVEAEPSITSVKVNV